MAGVGPSRRSCPFAYGCSRLKRTPGTWVLDMLPPTNWWVIVLSLLTIFAVATAFGSTARPLCVLAFRVGRRALVYLFGRVCSIIVDRLLEMLIFAFVAGIAFHGLSISLRHQRGCFTQLKLRYQPT